jgi:hypothetical protein
MSIQLCGTGWSVCPEFCTTLYIVLDYSKVLVSSSDL